MVITGILIALAIIFFWVLYHIEAWWEECDGDERRRSERGDG